MQFPRLAIFEVVEQFAVLRVSHVASPDHFCSVDASAIPNPFSMQIVITAITHDNELSSGHCLQLALDCRSFQISPRPGRFDGSMCRGRRHTDKDHGASQHGNGTPCFSSQASSRVQVP